MPGMNIDVCAFAMPQIVFGMLLNVIHMAPFHRLGEACALWRRLAQVWAVDEVEDRVGAKAHSLAAFAPASLQQETRSRHG